MSNENPNNTQQPTEKKEKVRLSLDIESPPEFNSLIQTLYTDSTSFCDELINPLLHSVFADFLGSKIEISQNRMIMTSLYFTEVPVDPQETRAYAIEKVISAESLKNVSNRIKMLNNSIGNGRYENKYKLTQDGKDVLEDLIPNAAKQQNGNIRWQNIVSEGSMKNTFSYDNDQSFLRIMVDINKFVRKIYGFKDKTSGETYQYMVTVGNPINPTTTYGGNIMAQQWQMFVMRLSGSVVNKIAKLYGISGQNDMGIVI